MVDVLILGGLAGIIGVGAVLYLWKAYSAPKPALTSTYQRFPLVMREALNHDTYLLRFQLPKPDQTVGLPVGKHMMLRQNESVVRAYTPITGNEVKGYFDLVVKVYAPVPENPETGRPAFAGGKMGNYLKNLKIGDTVEVKGPTGELLYNGRGEFIINRRVPGSPERVRTVTKVKRVGMVAGGTGLTPMLQVVQASLRDPQDTTQFTLLLANKSEADILYRSELMAMAEQHSRFRVFFTVDVGSPEWRGFTGFVNEEMLSQTMPFPTTTGDSDSMVLMCGPPPMINMLSRQLTTPHAAVPLPFTQNQIFAF